MKRYLIYAALAVALFFAGKIAWEHFRDPAKSEEIGRLKGQLHQDSVDNRAKIDSFARASAKVDTVQRVVTNSIVKWQTKVVHDTLRLPATATPHDTIVAVGQQLKACKETGGDVVTAVQPLQSSCDEAKAKAAIAIAGLQRQYNHLDTLYRAPRPGKHYNLSVSAGLGYATPLDSIAFRREAFVGLTVGRSLLSW